jgi:hypothetical protein
MARSDSMLVIALRRFLPIDDYSFPSFIATYSAPIVILFVSLITLIQGFRYRDLSYPVYFSMILHHDRFSIPVDESHLLEGLLGDFIGIFFLWLGLSPDTAMIMWWCMGLILLSLVIYVSIKYESVDIVDIVLLLVFSRVVDTLLMWFPKFDSYLMAALILSASRNKLLAITGIGIAALFHPFVTLISTAGIVIFRAAFERIWFIEGIVFASLMATIDLYLFHQFLPSLQNRYTTVFATISSFYDTMRLSGRWGVIAFISSIIVPFLMMAYFGSLQRIPYKYVTAIILWILLVGVLSSVFFDHTRDSCLLMVAPMIVFLRALSWCDERQNHMFILTFAIFGLIRTVIPHVAQDGILLAQWSGEWSMLHFLWRWIWSIV